MSNTLDPVTTALERAVAGKKRRRVTPHDALRAARQQWLADQRIDMGALATELGISRATLYNWVGDRERLIAEVAWSLADATIQHARAHARGTGASYVADANARYLRAVADFEPLRRFIERDPEFALGVLASKRTVFQQRCIDAQRELIEEQIRDAGYLPPLDAPTLAYVVVRIAESFIFNPVITGGEPDLDKAIEASRVLLHAAPLKR